MTAKQSSRNLEELVSFKAGSILSQVVARGNGFETTLFCLAAGTSISEHTTSRNAQVLVLRGKGVFTLAGEEIPMAAGVFITMTPGVKHALAAVEDTAFLLFQT